MNVVKVEGGYFYEEAMGTSDRRGYNVDSNMVLYALIFKNRL